MKNEKTKILIGENTADEGVRIASSLCGMGLYAYTRPKDGKMIFDSIVSELPDIVIADLSLPNMDMIELMSKVKNTLVKCPSFIVISDIKNSFIERQIIDGGASYYITRPFETELVCSVVNSIIKRTASKSSIDIEIMATNMIQQFGIPAHIKGYQYLRTAIILGVQDRNLIDRVTKQLYPKIAKMHSTTAPRVERAIRHAIEQAWNCHGIDIFSNISECASMRKNAKPTNSELIALTVDKILLQIKKNSKDT